MCKQNKGIFLFLLLFFFSLWSSFSEEKNSSSLVLEGSRTVGEILKKLLTGFQRKYPDMEITIKSRTLKKALTRLKNREIDGVLLTERSYRKYRDYELQFHPFLLRGYRKQGKLYYPFIYGIVTLSPPPPELQKLLNYLTSPEGTKSINSLGTLYLPYHQSFNPTNPSLK